jgi:hypothetical protein
MVVYRVDERIDEKEKIEGMMEEDAKYLEFYRKIQDEKHNTQPLEEPDSAQPYPLEASIREATRILAAAHQHEFSYLLNANHTALRGCTCGLAFVGLMAGPSPDALQWHQIHEAGE